MEAVERLPRRGMRPLPFRRRISDTLRRLVPPDGASVPVRALNDPSRITPTAAQTLAVPQHLVRTRRAGHARPTLGGWCWARAAATAAAAATLALIFYFY